MYFSNFMTASSNGIQEEEEEKTFKKKNKKKKKKKQKKTKKVKKERKAYPHLCVKTSFFCFQSILLMLLFQFSY